MPKHTRTTSKAAGLVLTALALVVSLLPALPAQAATAIAKISFQPADIKPPTGFTVDSGQAYTAARGFGWIDPSDSNPLDMTGNARYSWTKAAGYTTVLQMQQKATTGVITAGRWEYAVPNGTYDVTITAGDARSNDGVNYCCLDGINRLTVEGVLAINDYHSTIAAPLTTNTVTVAVSDGKLTIDPVGGVNTKIDQVTIAPGSGPAQPVTPVITSVTPAAGATQVPLNSAISLGLSQSVDLSTVNASNFTLTGPNGVVAGNYNADAAGGTASFTPGANLAVNTVYTVATTSGFLSAGGTPFAPFSATFTTGTAPPPLAATAFTKVASVAVPKPNVLTIGPDNKLYVGTAGGKIFRFTRAADGTLSAGESITPFGQRVITGLAFDPAHPTTLWVTNNYAGYTDAPRFSGHISKITIQAGQPLSADVASATDVIVGLPRSMHDHMTNGIAFGPDGKLYIAQGADTAYGAADTYWGDRGEVPLSASILVADVDNSTLFPSGSTLDVNTDPVGTTEDTGSDAAAAYNVAAGAPVTVYAYGIRNPFTLLWDSNGSLYAPVNESASGGNTPSPASNNPPPAGNVQAYTDYFTRVKAGKYYGHPNPSQGYYTLNGGNPTSAGDPYEVTEYPVGVQPDPNWQAPDFAMGVHRSPDGAAEYTNATAFSGALKGKILVSEYSDGDDIVAVNLDSSGKPVSEGIIPDAANPGQALIFNNPLGLATDAANGYVYVAEAQSETDPTAGLVTLLSPGVAAPPVNNGVHVNFQPASVTAPTGYSADTGAPFNGLTGWEDLNGSPLDLTANTRVRHSTLSPDVRYDTQLIMQALSGSGNTTPGKWVTTLPNGQYDVTVAVGDPTAINSVDEIVAQPGTADATTIIDHFAPTTAAPWSTQTKRVNVSNGVLVLSPAGGTQTKIDFVDAVPATTDTTPPVVTVALAGALATGTTYNGPVQATVTATDNVAVATLTYTLDGGTATAYTAPVTVSSVGSHTLIVTAADAAGNVTNSTTTFTITSTAPTSAHINFAAQTSAKVAGYTTDYGLAFDPVVGSGWENATTGVPTSLVGNGRERNSSLSPDKRYDTLVQMQQTPASSGGTQTPGQWEYVLANGDYNVTVAVGDATATNSVDRITAEAGTVNAVTIINNFQAVTGTLFQTVTKRVTVADGRLTLSPNGGSNTKIDYVDVVPAAPLVDSTPPTASIALAGTLVSGTTYTGPVTATITAADEALGSGLKSVTYSLDGGADIPYTTAVAVSDVGPHTLVVTATDNSNNIGHASASFTVNAPPPPDTTDPTASIALGGSTNGTIYTGDVTATVTAADEAGGSGLKSVTYSLDGGADTPYTAPVVVHAPGSHTLSVTATDNALNTFTTSTSWISQRGDTVPPTASIALAGTLYSPGVYTGNVTATITAGDGDGGSGLASVSYVLDGGTPTPYTGAISVTSTGPHTLAVTVTDNEANVGTASKSWTQQAPDTTPPTASVTLAGSTDGTTYTGDVTATITAADETGGSGLKTTTYVLDGAAAKTYTAPFVVTATGSHTITVTATDNAGNVGHGSLTWLQQSAGTPSLTVSSPDDAVLVSSPSRLVFSAVRGFAAPAPRSYTFTNTGTSALDVTNLAIGGTNANNWTLAAGQPTSIVVPAGGSAQVSIQFKPTDPTGCADSTSVYAIGDVDRTATLTYSTNDPAQPTGSSILSGVNSCYVGGNNEPVLDQLLPMLGYTDVVGNANTDRRFIGPTRYIAGTDEIQSPYFKVANAGSPVSIVPIAHYGSANTVPYQATGWYAAGSTMTAPNSTCSSACKTLWQFPADTVSNGVTTYNQNQKLLPQPVGTTTFTPTGIFGLFSGDFSDVNFSDDSLNWGHTTANKALPVPHYLHDMRVFPAYGPGHVLIPNTYIVGIDLSRVPAYKNNDFQDIVLLVRNVQPALTQGPVIGAATSDDLTTGGTVSPTCSVSGFDGVLANTGGTQCNAANIAFGANGLTLTSTAGQLANSNQQNALYKTFDATRNFIQNKIPHGFTITARVVGPVTQLTNDYQQIGAFFGPDQANFVKVEAEHNGTGDPHLTMFYSEKGVSGTVATVALPAMTTASTLDLIIKGNNNVPDPLPYGDTYGVSGFPLDELTVYYSINGATPVQVGTTKFPADVTGWFNRQSKAGILVSNSGTSTTFSATFSKFAITQD